MKKNWSTHKLKLRTLLCSSCCACSTCISNLVTRELTNKVNCGWPDRMSWSLSSTLITASAIPSLVSLSLTTPLMPLWTWVKTKYRRFVFFFRRWDMWRMDAVLLQTDLLHVNQQRLLVVLPLDGKLTGMRELVTRQLHRHLKAVGVQVTEVIHTWGGMSFKWEFTCIRSKKLIERLLFHRNTWKYKKIGKKL